MPDRTEQLLALNAVVELEGIDFDELHARRIETPEPAPRDLPIEVKPEYVLDIEIADDGKGFRVKLGMDIDLGIGEVRVHTAARYRTEQYEGELTLPLLTEYANEVTIMALLPYHRHAIADLTQRIFGPPLVMPIIQRGEIAFNVPVEDDEAVEEA